MPKKAKNITDPTDIIYTEPFSERLAQWLRDHPETSMHSLDRKAGLTLGSVRNLVMGRNERPGIWIARKICEAMGVDFGEFMLPERSRQEQEILSLTAKLRDEEIQLILDLTKGLADTRHTGIKRHFAKTG